MKKNRLITLFVLLMGLPMMFVSAAVIINPKTTSNFAILSGSTTTNTGSTTISGTGGNIGLFTGTSFVNKEGVTTSGTLHLTDNVSLTAKDDLVTVYNQVSSILPVTTISSELGGQTIIPGVYDSKDGTFHITGTLILDAKGDPNALFIFKSASTLITASGSKIILANDADYCQVYWKVGSSATLGTNSNFVGRIYSQLSITVTTGAKIQGQLLARDGSVTLDTNTITSTNCPITSIIKDTVTGGDLPNTSTNLYQTLFVGIFLVIIGVLTLISSRIYEKSKVSK